MTTHQKNTDRSGGLDLHRIGAVYPPDFCSFNYSDERCQPDGALIAWLAIASKGMEASLRMDSFLTWLATEFPGRYNYITQPGDPVILSNGMEFSVIYFIMLLILLFWGEGVMSAWITG